MSAPLYKFNYGEPGHFVEVYLPKKAVYQGTLHDTLTKGFDLEAVREHFLEREADVKEFLKDNEELRGYTTEQAKRLSPSFNGYSLYELDGVFRSPRMPAPLQNRYEERVQVVRLMFLPPDDLCSDVPGSDKERQLAARRYIRFWTQDWDEYQADLDRHSRNGARQQIGSRLHDWLRDVGLFLHGYILFKLCETIEKVSQECKDGSIKPEEEIWLTSLRCLAVVRTTRLQDNTAEPGVAHDRRQSS
jgi:hypothetical protein